MVQKHSGFESQGIITGNRWQIIDFGYFAEVVVGTGSTFDGLLRMRTYTGATAASTAALYQQFYYKGAYTFPFGKAFEIEFVFAHLEVSGANGKTYIKIDDDDAPTDPDSAAFGFRVDQNALKGIVHNGAALTVVDLSTTLIIQAYRLKIKFIPGDKIYWYVDGVEKGSSANIPSGNRSVDIILAVMNGADAADQRAAIGKIDFWQKW